MLVTQAFVSAEVKRRQAWWEQRLGPRRMPAIPMAASTRR